LQQFAGNQSLFEKSILGVEQQSATSKVMKWKTIAPSSVSISSERVKGRFFNRSIQTPPSLNLPIARMPSHGNSLHSQDLIVVARPFPSDAQILTGSVSTFKQFQPHDPPAII